MARAMAALVALVLGCGAPVATSTDGGHAVPVEPRPDVPRPNVEEDAGLDPPSAPRAGIDRADIGDPQFPLRDASPADCGRCHRRELREWSRSGHHAAFTNRLFEAEHHHGGSAWCEGCHAPRARDVDEEPELAALGVDCATCHVRGGVVESARASGYAPHETRVVPELGTEQACARCHEFDFPDGRGIMLQRTVSEWHQSGRAETCLDCHMGRGHRGHRFGGARDPRMLARALEVRARASLGSHGSQSSFTQFRLTLRAAGVGHAVPTGDLARRLLVRASTLEGSEREVELMRRFGYRHRQRYLLADDRVPPGGERVVELSLPRTRAVRWSVELVTAPFREEDWEDLRDLRTHFPVARGIARVRP